MAADGVLIVGGREVCSKTPRGRAEYARRVSKMADRQGNLCAICEQYMTAPTFEHQDGRGMGGSLRDDVIEKQGKWYNAATCYQCNSRKGSRRYEWADGHFVPLVWIKISPPGLLP